VAVIHVTSVLFSGTDSRGNAVFEAKGVLNDSESNTIKYFTAQTIQWRGEPVFKIQGAGKLSDSIWHRGERIAVAKACKSARLEKFGGGHKEKIVADIPSGQTVELRAGCTSLEGVI